MAKNIKRHVSHIKSSIIENGGPKLPEPNDLVEGEIAINYASGYETLSVKNSSGNIATFTSDTTRDAQMETISYALNDLNERINNETSVISELSGSVSAMTEQISETNDTLDEFQEVAAAAFNQLDVDKAERSDVEGIQDILDSTVNKMGETIHYLTGMTGANGGTNLAASWSGNCSEITELYTGLCVRFLIPTAGHSSGVTLSINGGPKHTVFYNASTKLTTHYSVNTILNLTYDASTTGTYYSGSSTQASVQGVWRANSEYYKDTNTDTIGYSIGPNYTTFTSDVDAKRYMLFLTKDETNITPVSNGDNVTAATKTISSTKFDPFGSILYKSSTGTTAAGTAIASGTVWTQHTVNLSYSFNTTNNLIAGKDVYIVAEMQDDGKAILRSGGTTANTITQTLPTEEDGYIYIYLGKAYNTTSIQLMPYHPVYQYKVTNKVEVVDGILTKCKDFMGFTSGGTDNNRGMFRVKAADVSDLHWHTTKKNFVKVNGTTYNVVTFVNLIDGDDCVPALSSVPYVYDCNKYLYDGTDLVASGQADCYCNGHLVLYTNDNSSDRIDNLEDAVMQIQYDSEDAIKALNNKIDKFSEIISTALNDLNNRILDNRYDIDTLLNS